MFTDRGRTVVHGRNVAGLLPAAGHARRLGALPCSKEILPVRIAGDLVDGAASEVASASVLRAMEEAGIVQVHFLIRAEKWDVARHWGSGACAGVHLTYHLVEDSPSTVVTLDAAYPFVRDRTIALGFPDVVYDASQIFARLLERQEESGADVVLALFPTVNPEKVDTVNISRDGLVGEIRVKSASSPFEWAWSAAVWTPLFTDFLHRAVRRERHDSATRKMEVYLGEMMTRARKQGLTIDSVTFPDGRFMDIGTPDEWREVLARIPGRPEPEKFQRPAHCAIPAYARSGSRK